MQNGLLEVTATPLQPNFPHTVTGNNDQDVLPGNQFREARRRTSSLSYVFAKRLIDITICLVLLFAFGPILLLIALAVRLSSHGPVLYREVRIGRYGQRFTIYKFRSMYTQKYLVSVLGYDECEISQLRRRQHGKVTGDPRITRIGRLLRETSLDELPQILNVLKGDMSLIGPRPVVAAELMSYGDRAALYKLVLPGISGLWQISGRSNLSFEERVRLDAQYCIEWDFAQDMRIFLKTLPAVAKKEGAY